MIQQRVPDVSPGAEDGLTIPDEVVSVHATEADLTTAFRHLECER